MQAQKNSHPERSLFTLNHEMPHFFFPPPCTLFSCTYKTYQRRRMVIGWNVASYLVYGCRMSSCGGFPCTHHNHQTTLLKEHGSFFGNTIKRMHINTIAFLFIYFLLELLFSVFSSSVFFFSLFLLKCLTFSFQTSLTSQTTTQQIRWIMLSKLRTPSISSIATRHASTCAVCASKMQQHSHQIFLIAHIVFFPPHPFFSLSFEHSGQSP